MSSNQLKGALYLRVSTRVQDEESQEPDLRKRAKIDGVKIVEEFVFRDKISGLKDETERDGLNQLLKLQKSEIDIVYIWEISRLSRRPTHFDRLVAEFREKGINICFVKPQLLYLFDLHTGEEKISDNIALSIFSKFALYEIEQKNVRSKRGKQAAILDKKNSYTYKPPFGYKTVNKKLIINNDIISEFAGFKTEAEVVKSIFEMYVSGSPLGAIKKVLNEHSLPTRTHNFQKKNTIKLNNQLEKDITSIQWGRRSIHNILQNTVYYGEKDIYSTKTELVDRKPKKVRYKVDTIDVPAIITEELFLQAQQQMKANIAVANKAYKNEFLLRGLLKCGECGNYYLGTGSKGKNYYHCADRTHRRHNTYLGCKNASITIKMDNVIWNSIKSIYQSKKVEETTKGNLNNLEQEKANLEQSISLKEKAISENEKNLNHLADHLANTPPALATRLYKNAEKLDKEIEDYKKEIKSIKLKIAFIEKQIESIKKGQNTKIEFENIDDNFKLKSEAAKELIYDVYTTKADGVHRIIEVTLKNGYYFILIYNWNKQRCVELPHNLYSFDRNTRVFQSKSYNIKGFSLEPIIKKNIQAETLFKEYLEEATYLS